MDKTAIKKYAVWARKELISRVAQKAQQYGITETEMVDAGADSVNGKVLSAEEMQQRRALIAQINEKGYQQVMEEVAYTWFNRFSALRFMEVNGYLPSHVRVFTDENNAFKPQILAEALHLELDKLDKDKVYALKETEQTEELYKYLLIVQCNALNSILPGMFQTIADYTELLLPDNLLREGSVIEQMISQIPEDNWQDAVQIIGWLYQYYNSEKKDDVFAALKKNVKITKENIPAATQLFTPDWIVRYMVENSLGRLWVEGHPDAKAQLLPTLEEQAAYTAGKRDPEDTKWHYYLEEAQQEPQVQAQLSEISKQYADLTPEQIKVIDPCCGSGHILAYLFDVLMQIYENYGYTPRDAVASILQNNLYGLDIDDRAAQLAYFAVMMKARRYDRRFFSHTTQPHVYVIEESNRIEKPDVEYFCNGKPELKDAMHTILTQLYDAKEYGSILTIPPQDWDALYARFDEVADESSFHRESIRKKLLPLVRVAQTLAQKYDVVVTNPPYMGASNMNPKLNEFIKQNYTDYKSDFFSAFIVKCSSMAKPEGYCGLFTPYVWMFIQSYEKLRQYIYQQATLETLIQFEYSAFEEATVPVCTFTFSNRYVNKKGCYLRLVDFRGGMEVQRQKTLEAMTNHDCGFYYEQSTDNFAKIPGSPVAYWVSNNFLKAFDNEKIGKYTISDGQTKTGNNDKYLRLLWEVPVSEIGKGKHWVLHAKGGAFRRWYGNIDTLIDWSDSAREHYRTDHVARIAPEYIWFRKGICWTLISSNKLHGFRLLDDNSTFNLAAPSVFFNNDRMMFYILGYLNSKFSQEIIALLNPTLNTNISDITAQPLYYGKLPEQEDMVINLVSQNIALSKADWDSFETSWDFTRHPFIKAITKYPNRMDIGNIYLAECYDIWAGECEERFEKLKANEEELNRIFIDIYGLQDELTPEVEDKDVTVRKADLGRDVRSFISYAVGCMFGRYSPTYDGLAYAGGTWDDGKYNIYKPDADGIIPICDDEYFEDDMMGRFVEFVRVVYGDSSLEDNLLFIAKALGGKGQPKEVIRNYFLNDFYADHCKIYQKRPIYWLFDSGKKNGFKCLIYLHRYQPDTIARIRTDYVHEQQARYRTAIEGLEKQVAAATSTSERVKLTKQLNKVQAQDTELHQYEEKVHALADQMIKIDLDDGVKHNYEIFKDVLAKIK
mgnify:CR=1 FL=1